MLCVGNESDIYIYIYGGGCVGKELSEIYGLVISLVCARKVASKGKD